MSALPQPPLLRLAHEVRQARKRRPTDKNTQEELASDVRAATNRKLTAGAISQIENGRIRPELETVDALAVVLGDHLRDTIEYRLALARRNLDERIVGVEAAIGNLNVPPIELLPPMQSPAEIAEQAAAHIEGTPTPTAPARHGRPKKGRAA